MPSSSIVPQDPSMSPTYGMSAHSTQHTTTGSIRRNLFAGHLSRRPTATSSDNPFATPASHADEHTVAALFPVNPSAQQSRRNLGFDDIYDPDASPPPTTSQTATATTRVLSRESIIALHPVTGRPLLPNLPTLPSRLRLTDGDEEEEENSDEDNEQHHGTRPPGFTRSPSYHSGLNHLASEFDLDQDMDLDSSELERFSAYQNPAASSMRLNIRHFFDATSEESHADGERIEYLLLEMASRQRARARTIPTPEPPNSNLADPLNGNPNRGMSGSSTTQLPGTSILSSSRRRAGATGGPYPTGSNKSSLRQTRRDPSPQKPDSYLHLPSHIGSTSTDASLLPVGKAIDPIEKEELVGLIMTSLRRKVAIADEEGWMYGDRDSMGMSANISAMDGEPFD